MDPDGAEEFEGCFYRDPPPVVVDKTFDIAAYELDLLHKSGSFVGKAVLVEHDGDPDTKGTAVGVVRASWKEPDGRHMVRFTVSNKSVVARIESGELQGLSLGHVRWEELPEGAQVYPAEVSLCHQPRRANVTSGGGRVRSVRRNAASSGGYSGAIHFARRPPCQGVVRCRASSRTPMRAEAAPRGSAEKTRDGRARMENLANMSIEQLGQYLQWVNQRKTADELEARLGLMPLPHRAQASMSAAQVPRIEQPAQVAVQQVSVPPAASAPAQAPAQSQAQAPVQVAAVPEPAAAAATHATRPKKQAKMEVESESESDEEKDDGEEPPPPPKASSRKRRAEGAAGPPRPPPAAHPAVFDVDKTAVMAAGEALEKSNIPAEHKSVLIKVLTELGNLKKQKDAEFAKEVARVTEALKGEYTEEEINEIVKTAGGLRVLQALAGAEPAAAAARSGPSSSAVPEDKVAYKGFRDVWSAVSPPPAPANAAQPVRAKASAASAPAGQQAASQLTVSQIAAAAMQVAKSRRIGV